MKRYLIFLAIGTLFSTVEEFLTVVVLEHDVGSYIFTLLILFPLFLSIAYFFGKLFTRLPIKKPSQELARSAEVSDLAEF